MKPSGRLFRSSDGIADAINSFIGFNPKDPESTKEPSSLGGNFETRKDFNSRILIIDLCSCSLILLSIEIFTRYHQQERACLLGF